jgi:SprT protein
MERVEVPDELKKRINEKIAEGLAICFREYGKRFPFPTIHYSVYNSAAGYADSDTWEIFLNPVLLINNIDQYIDEIPLHELGHLIADKIFPLRPYKGKKRRIHGKRWIAVMDALGCKYDSTHSFDVSMFTKSPHVYQCIKCGREHHFGTVRHTRMQKNRAYYRCSEGCSNERPNLKYLYTKEKRTNGSSKNSKEEKSTD